MQFSRIMRGRRERERERERETDNQRKTNLDSRVLSDSFGVVGPINFNILLNSKFFMNMLGEMINRYINISIYHQCNFDNKNKCRQEN